MDDSTGAFHLSYAIPGSPGSICKAAMAAAKVSSSGSICGTPGGYPPARRCRRCAKSWVNFLGIRSPNYLEALFIVFFLIDFKTHNPKKKKHIHLIREILSQNIIKSPMFTPRMDPNKFGTQTPETQMKTVRNGFFFLSGLG